jgi:hypothetical protein
MSALTETGSYNIYLPNAYIDYYFSKLLGMFGAY